MAGGVEPKTRRRRGIAVEETRPTTPDPVEISMEIAASGQTPGDAALEVLRINAALMREQIGLARNERFRNRIKAVRDIAIALVVLLLAVGALGFVWNARQASGLVIQPLSTPPDLVARGLDGQAIASQIQDRLNQLQDDTDSSRPANTFANNWQGNVSVEIPSTGISIGELDQTLRAALGNETVVSGEITRNSEALAITVRTGGAARTIVSEVGDVDALIQGAAEAIYGMTQTYRYGFYLLDNGRREEGLIVIRQIASAGVPIDRAYANLGLGVDRVRQGDIQGAIGFISRAKRIHPGLVQVENNEALYRHLTGEFELALAHRRSALEGLQGSGKRFLLDGPAEVIKIRSQALVAQYLGDFQLAAEGIGSLVGKPEYSGIVATAPIHQASLFVAMHDPSGARRVLADAGLGSVVQIAELAARNENFLIPTAEVLMERELWAEALAELQAYDAAITVPVQVAQKPMVLWPRMAEALAHLGRFEEAEALAARMPGPCYPCVIGRARVAMLRGDLARADRLYAEARRQGPSLPFAFAERGQMLMARGDIAGAIDFYEQAIERGPRWADPQKFWGDALMAQGDEAGAIRKYRAAADRAPQWGALHLAWGRALEAQGKRDQARQTYTEAARMDLSAADRAEVGRRLRAVSRRA
jgi:tetratricopeptide (TPR) repeat protein